MLPPTIPQQGVGRFIINLSLLIVYSCRMAQAELDLHADEADYKAVDVELPGTSRSGQPETLGMWSRSPSIEWRLYCLHLAQLAGAQSMAAISPAGKEPDSSTM